MRNFNPDIRPSTEIYPDKQEVVVDSITCVPQNTDTAHIRALIGRPLTRFEMAHRKVRLEFGESGCLVIEMRNLIEITASIAPGTANGTGAANSTTPEAK